MENQGVKLDIIEKRLQATIAELEIGHLMNKTMFGMSGGEKQIIAMACAYAADTPIVILDEPSANLDERATNTIAKIISKMKSSGKTVVIAEHRVAYLKGIADRAVLVENGRILDILTADAFYNKDEQWRKTHGLRQLKSNSYFPEISAPRLASESAKKQLSVKGLALSHEKQIIASDICFDIFSGEIVALMGENGAGKTTLSRCLCGLFSEDSGDITFNGKPLTAKQRRKAAYMVMQDVNHQLFSQSVLDECALGNDETTRDDIVCMLNKFGLSEYLNAHPQTLSCGQKQRLAVAVAMLSGKEILIFDEPTSGLDYENMYSISQTMKEIARRGHMVLVITHDTELIEAACTRCVQLAPTGILEVSTTHVNPSTIIE